ncbi:MAG: DUF4037 domain-containing protein [Spirochaetia bacterium]
MSARAEFIPGLRLGRLFFEEAGRRIVESVVPPNAYAAALIGKGSDVLGFDTARSTDHDWGPRFQVFLGPEAGESTASRLDDALRNGLPPVFRGFAVGVSESAESPARPHLVEISRVGEFLQKHLAVSDVTDLPLLDWLTFPEQRLLELTSGEIFHDPRGELRLFRELLGRYPRDVWLYRMACQWQRLSQEEAFAGRCAESGDMLGMKVVAARIIRDAMKLCFLMEGRYAPYEKWLGTAFSRLACASRMMPLLSAALDAPDYPALEPNLGGLYRMLGDLHNALKVTGPMDPAPRQFFSRPYVVMRADRFANALLNAVDSEELRRIPVRMGAVDQFVDSTDFIEHAETYRKVLALYR